MNYEGLSLVLDVIWKPETEVPMIFWFDAQPRSGKSSGDIDTLLFITLYHYLGQI